MSDNIELKWPSGTLQAVLDGTPRLSLGFAEPMAPAVLRGPAKLDLKFAQGELNLELRPILVGPPGASGTDQPKSPVFAYTGGKLTDINYADGSIKTLTYDGQEQLSRVVFVRAGLTVTKDFSYNPDGTLASINETEI